METKTEVEYSFIQTDKDLLGVIPEVEAAPIISLDTEGTTFDPFMAKVLLLQIATKGEVYVIDCTKVDISPLKVVLEVE